MSVNDDTHKKYIALLKVAKSPMHSKQDPKILNNKQYQAEIKFINSKNVSWLYQWDASFFTRSRSSYIIAKQLKDDKLKCIQWLGKHGHKYDSNHDLSVQESVSKGIDQISMHYWRQWIKKVIYQSYSFGCPLQFDQMYKEYDMFKLIATGRRIGIEKITTYADVGYDDTKVILKLPVFTIKQKKTDCNDTVQSIAELSIEPPCKKIKLS